MLYPPKPMYAAPGSDYHLRLVSNQEWACEPKKDGIRVLAVDGRYYTRVGNLVEAEWLPRIPTNVILDGEMMRHERQVWWFDIPSHPGPLVDRRAALVGVAEELGLRVSPWWTADGALERALDGGDEGVVFKRLSSKYQWQLEPNNKYTWWVKVKP